jgi:hypothetical protein
VKTVEQLLTEWQAGTISQEELAQLREVLSKPAARSELLLEWQLDAAIYETLRAEAAAPAAAPSPAPTPTRAPASHRRSLAIGRQRRLFPWLVWREARISWRLPAGMAAALCLLIFGLTLYFRAAAVGRIDSAPARTMVEHNGRSAVAIPGQSLYVNDTLRLPPETTGPAVVTLGADSARLEVAPGAELRLLNAWRGKRVTLQTGKLQAMVAPQGRWRPMTLLTPQAEAKVVGTQFSLSVTGEVTRLSVLEGAVRLRKTVRDAASPLPEVLVRAGQMAVAARQTRLETALLTGFLSSDSWLAPSDTALSDAPARSVATAKAPGRADLARVERLRGYLVAPASGEFTFWIGSLHGGSPAELWLSPDEKTSSKQRIAWVAGQGNGVPSAPPLPAGTRDFRTAMLQEWRRSPTQRSALVNLVQGERYYIEIWHRGSGIDSLALGWTPPGAPAGSPVPIDIHMLCPFIAVNAGQL